MKKPREIDIRKVFAKVEHKPHKYIGGGLKHSLGKQFKAEVVALVD